MPKFKIREFKVKSAMTKNLEGRGEQSVYVMEPANPKGKPILIFLAGMMGSGKSMLFNDDFFAENMQQRIERLYASGRIKGSIYVFPDLMTKFGGCQYTNSTVAGNYEDFIINEMIPYIKSVYKSEKVAILGKSSGGYGAMILAMKHPELINAAMDHSGDSYFEYCYMPDFPKARRSIEPFGSAEAWLANFSKKLNKKGNDDLSTLNIISMAAFYSSKGRKIELPFDLHTGKIREDIWSMWLSNDPIRMVDTHYKALQKLDFLGIDVGLYDQFNLLEGSRALHEKLSKLHVKHTYSEFKDSHINTSYRYDISIPLVEKALYKRRG
ncbi:MAG: alpha/beta hydrolase-fold protein [Candidatus Marsarchaeota archaeon]|jgi:pimeloyl-ACP methyl ester carboxylesterase|nr:alpha/beta hydrolase-fold protein [Candidatus Marsarchaeota archaeon]